MGQLTKRLFPITFSANCFAPGNCGISLNVSTVFGYLLGNPKQFTPAIFLSAFAIGSTSMLGKPGYGILVGAVGGDGAFEEVDVDEGEDVDALPWIPVFNWSEATII